MNHETFEILLEKRLNGAETADEALQLDAHLPSCDPCRLELDSSRNQEALLRQECALLVGDFDFNAAQQAIQNRVAREKSSGVAPKIFGLLVSLTIFWPVAETAGGLAYSCIAFALIATFAFWEYSSRVRPQRLLASAMAGDEELIGAFEQHGQEVKKERRGEQIAALLGALVLVAMAVQQASSGELGGAIVGLLLLHLVWVILSAAFARQNRQRNDLLDRGVISWNDYLLWSAPSRAAGRSSNLEPSRRRLFALRSLQFALYLMLLYLAVDRGGVWIWAVAAVVLVRITKRISDYRRNKLMTPGDDRDE
jgi:hypothetical protein